jgi:hypothetical protein
MASEKPKTSQSRLTKFFTKVDKPSFDNTNQEIAPQETFVVGNIKQEPEVSYVLILPPNEEEEANLTINDKQAVTGTKTRSSQGNLP